jgi:hypothetical protein
MEMKTIQLPKGMIDIVLEIFRVHPHTCLVFMDFFSGVESDRLIQEKIWQQKIFIRQKKEC